MFYLVNPVQLCHIKTQTHRVTTQPVTGCIISVDKLKVTNKPLTVYSPTDSWLTGMKVTVSFYPLSDKEHTLLATDCLLISLSLAIF